MAQPGWREFHPHGKCRNPAITSQPASDVFTAGTWIFALTKMRKRHSRSVLGGGRPLSIIGHIEAEAGRDRNRAFELSVS